MEELAHVEFETTAGPFECANSIIKNNDEYKIYEEHHKIGQGKEVCVLVFEKYFFRTGGTGALTVVLENLSGINKVKCIPAGTSQGFIDWGVRDSLVERLKNMLGSFIIER